jgi:metal transporter CNNM
MSFDDTQLNLIINTGSVINKLKAEEIKKIKQKHHLLLVTLIFSNALFAEALPILINSLMSSWKSLILSVTIIVLIAEIVPTAIFTSKKKLQYCYNILFIVKGLIYVFYIICYPISLLLDKIIQIEPVDIVYVEYDNQIIDI